MKVKQKMSKLWAFDFLLMFFVHFYCNRCNRGQWWDGTLWEAGMVVYFLEFLEFQLQIQGLWSMVAFLDWLKFMECTQWFQSRGIINISITYQQINEYDSMSILICRDTSIHQDAYTCHICTYTGTETVIFVISWNHRIESASLWFQDRCTVFAQCRGQLFVKPEKPDVSKAQTLGSRDLVCLWMFVIGIPRLFC